ncbi:MAG: hypothetical protein L3J89_03845 [Gammaproteobacteria bacterium]|nr:hypothetical protein [Gammaproteobacteria bacterium]
MGMSPVTKEWLASILALGFGFGCLVGMILLLFLYFRLTRKYDAMFPEYDRIIPLPLLMGTVVRTGYYSGLIVFKNLIHSKRHHVIHDVTNGYNFRGNAPLLDIILSYLYLFIGFLTVGSLIALFFLTKVLGVKL